MSTSAKNYIVTLVANVIDNDELEKALKSLPEASTDHDRQIEAMRLTKILPLMFTVEGNNPEEACQQLGRILSNVVAERDEVEAIQRRVGVRR